MRLGIVGSEGSKFTPESEKAARAAVRELIELEKPDVVVSGGCHLGGIDIWAVEEARALGIATIEHKPIFLQWAADGGFRDRNLAIANDSDLVVCISVDRLPPGREPDPWNRGPCYHCRAGKGCDKPHIKSGGCWTVIAASRMGKRTGWVVLTTN